MKNVDTIQTMRMFRLLSFVQLLLWKQTTYCCRAVHLNDHHSHLCHHTRSGDQCSGRSCSACSLSYIVDWLWRRTSWLSSGTEGFFFLNISCSYLFINWNSPPNCSVKTHHNRTASHQTCPCSGPCRHRSDCSWCNHHSRTQSHRHFRMIRSGLVREKRLNSETFIHSDEDGNVMKFNSSSFLREQVLSSRSCRSPRQLQLTRPSDVGRHRSWQPPLFVRQGENSPEEFF